MLIQLVIIIICIGCSIQILRYNGSKRLIYFLWGITFCNYGVEIFPHLSVLRSLTFIFYISVFIRKNDRLVLMKIPLKKQFVLLFAVYLCTGLFDDRSCYVGLYKAILEYMETFGFILLGYVSLCHTNELHKLLHTVPKIALCVSVYSIITYLAGADIVNSQIPGTDFSMSSWARVRIPSFYYSSHLAGAAISSMLIVIISPENKWSVKHKLLISALLLVALTLTGSRSSILASFAGLVFVYYYFFYKNLQSHKILLFILGIGVIGIITVFIDRISFLSDMFEEGGGDTGGSNIFMRLQQLVYSYELFLQSPYFGNGFKYFWEVVKVNDDFLSSMLLGAESYIFILLIERGLIQIIAIVYFFFSLIKIFMQYRNEIFVVTCIGLTWAFLFNSIVTGNGEKWSYMMIYVGCGLSVIGNCRKNILCTKN